MVSVFIFKRKGAKTQRGVFKGSEKCFGFLPSFKSHSLCLGLISFLLSFNYYLLKTVKDALIMTAEASGAEAIPFIKVWILLPVSIAMVFAFIWLANRFPLKKLCGYVIGFFLLFFLLFTFVLYPLQDYLHPHAFANWLQEQLPVGWKGLVAVIRHWPFSLFYVMAESWGSIVYVVLFWGLVNEITSLEEAQRSYPFFILSGNVAAFFAGALSIAISSTGYLGFSFLGKSNWEQSLTLLTLIFLVCGWAAWALFRWIYPDEREIHLETKHLKSHMTIKEALIHLSQSKVLWALGMITLSFNMIINLAEVAWKNQILALYPDPNDYNIYMNYVTISIGIVSTLLTLFVCSASLRRFGWTFTAALTPISILLTASAFFGFVWMSAVQVAETTAFFGMTPAALLTFLASLHICLMLSGKYSLYDMTKQMAYIPLDPEQRLKGKAAIDGVGGGMGKVGSSLFYQGLLIVLPSISACTPYVGVVLFGMVGIYLLGVIRVGQQFEAEQVAEQKVTESTG